MKAVWPSLRGPALFLAVLAGPLAAQGRDVVSLNSQVVDPRRPGAGVSDSLRAQPGDDEYLLVKFPGPPTAAQVAALQAWSARVYTYLPHDAFLVRRVRGQREQRDAELRALGASFVEPYHPAYKLSRWVRELRAPAAAEGTGRPAPRLVMLQVFPDADLERVSAQVAALGARVVGSERNPFFSRLRLLETAERVAALREDLARIPEVFWVDLESRRRLYNDTSVWVGQSGLLGGQATPVFDKGIHGEGQVVAYLDTGVDADMCYFRESATDFSLPPVNACDGGTLVNNARRKVIAADFLWSSECAGGISATEWDTQNHGTHVGGTIAGDNFATPIGHDAADGMAPGAKLVVQDCGYQVNPCADCPGIGCPVVDLNPVFQQTYDQGARIHSNSWGDQEDAMPQNDYTTGSQDVDEFMWNHKDFLLVFAAGNSGPGTATVGSPSTAKSALSVGATLRGSSADSLASFSSCGPTDDGRIKPEITFPGSGIVSAGNDASVGTNNCGTRSMSGTSMATPGIAGLGALVRQYYADGFYPSGVATVGDAFNPSAALVRATLISSATSMTGVAAIPSNCQGWGRALLDDALYFQGDTRQLFAKDDEAPFPTGSSGETRSYAFTIANPATPFKATLAWTDYPSTPAANPHVNNDLDLEVSGPGGLLWRGNVFSGGTSSTGGSADRLNTLEQVLLATPTPGVYTVTVRSFNVPNGPQPFALVVTADFAPAGPDTTPPTAAVSAPSNGATVGGGVVTITATASDDFGVTQVEFYVDGLLRCTDATPPYTCDWDVTNHKRLVPHALYVKAYDLAGNVGTSPAVSVIVDNTLPMDQLAAYDAALKAPKCATAGKSCDSGPSLLLGRGTMAPGEPNQPNTVGASCADGSSGTFHSDESNDRLKVFTNDGSFLAPGKTVTVQATVWAYSTFSSDKLELFYAASAASPAWTKIGATLTPTAAGQQALSASFTLPSGALQAVRARFRFNGSDGSCSTGSYDDHDDLVFAVAPAAAPEGREE